MAGTDTLVTFLFTDIEGSTRLLHRLGESYQPMLARHRRILRRCFAEHEGDEFGDNEGDAFYVSFADAAQAIAAAFDAQQALASATWGDCEQPPVRMGVHSGIVAVSPTGMSGMALHEAARVRDAAHGGQVVVSEAAALAAGERSVPEGAALRDLGVHRLRDIAVPVRLFQLEHPDLSADFPPLRVEGTAPDEPAPSRDGIGVLLVDDQEMVRAGFRMILEAREGISVVGEAADGAEAVEAVARLQPDVVLMDIRMPKMDGIEATARIVDVPGDRPRVLVLTTFDLDEYVMRALEAGASGFLLKDAPPNDLVHAIGVVARGDALLAPSVTRRLVEQVTSSRATDPAAAALVRGLTERETDVLRLIARGRSNAEIAAELFLGETTIKGYVSNVLAKLEVRDRVQAVVVAYESGLVRPGDG